VYPDGFMADFKYTRKKTDAKGIYVNTAYLGRGNYPDIDDLIKMLDETELNAMVIDIKDDVGSILFDAQHPLVNEIGSETLYIRDLPAFVAKLKEQEPQDLDDILMGVTLDDLHTAFLQVMARQETKVDRVRSSFRSVQKDLFTVSEKMEYIRDLLILRPHGTTAFHTIFRENAGKMEKVVTFLALLELIKQKEVQITQERNFGEILISKYSEGGAA
ncbi:MAG: segregation/condensation protein A, partial [Anaerotignum sp.]|nr:segregation/condensation protein A [Anaerotignum sp.]